MSDEVVSNNPFMLKNCLDRYETKKLCDKTVHDCLPTFKFVHCWFAASKMFEQLCDALFTNDGIAFFDEDFGSATFFANKMGLFLEQILIILTLMLLIFMKIIMKLSFVSDFWLSIINLNNEKHFKKISAKN